MKTWNLEAESAEFDRLHPSTDCVCDRIVSASERVRAVEPLKPSLPDEKPSLEAVLSDCEALNDEIAHLREIARRAQQREAAAIKRCESLGISACHDY